MTSVHSVWTGLGDSSKCCQSGQDSQRGQRFETETGLVTLVTVLRSQGDQGLSSEQGR